MPFVRPAFKINHMPWTRDDYPNSMKFLSRIVREKAIDIANALAEEKTMQEGVIIATAISRAKDWAATRGIEPKTEVKSKTTDANLPSDVRSAISQLQEGMGEKEEKRFRKIFTAKPETKGANLSVSTQGKKKRNPK
jgi:uncharacterized protein YdaT